MVNVNELKQHVEENNDGKKVVGETNVRLDSKVVQDAKEAVGVTQNTELSPLIEALLLESIEEDERAEEKEKEFKEQF